MPGTSANTDFCKTFLSAMILNYPPPTVVNWQQTEDEPEEELETNPLAKIKALNDYLEESKHIDDEDLVLVVDAYSVWFQLPSDVLIKQYHHILKKANARLLRRYGVTNADNENELSDAKYTQTVLIAADSACDAAGGNPALCAAVPESPFGSSLSRRFGVDDVYTTTDKPKYPKRGSVIGPARDLKALFSAALTRGQQGDEHSPATNYILTKIFVEQHLAREAKRSSENSMYRWQDWLSKKLATMRGLDQPDIPINITSSHRYEFSLGLDYSAHLFQPIDDMNIEQISFRTFDGSTNVTNTTSGPQHPHAPKQAHIPHIPKPLLHSPPPFSDKVAKTEALTPSSKSPTTSNLNPKPFLDTLPGANTSWTALSFLTNTNLNSVPATISLPPAPGLLIDSPLATLRTTHWSKLWYHPYARALLRRYLRSPQGPIAAHVAAVGGDQWWDMRGGQGGVWTVRDEWLGWSDVCAGEEWGVFGDGKGEWMREREQDRQEVKDPQLEDLRNKINEAGGKTQSG